MKKKLGKIVRVTFGAGGYQDAMFGLSLEFDCDGGHTTDFIGTWSTLEESENLPECKEVALKSWMRIETIMQEAQVDEIHQLVGIPVECEYDGQLRTGWRILTEVL